MTLLAPPRSAPKPAPQSPWTAVRHVDWVLALATAGLTAIGIASIYSTTVPIRRVAGLEPFFWVNRQLVYVAVGVVAMIVVAAIDYAKLRELAMPLYVASMASLVAVLLLGETINGARAWFVLGPVQLQPTELAKVVLIVVLSAYLADERADELPFNRFMGGLALSGAMVALVLLQPDLGSASVIIVLTMTILLVARAKAAHIALITGLVAFSSVLVVASGTLARYQTERLTSFLAQEGVGESSDLVLQVQQSQRAISLGQITGKGYLEGPLTNGGYVAEQRTDFIFSAIGEQWGFVGGAAVLVLFSVILLRIWRNAQLSRDVLGSLICAGVFGVFAWHIFENVGMAMGIMPVTGIPLPLVSYGGSSTIAFFLMLGLVHNVHLRKL